MHCGMGDTNPRSSDTLPPRGRVNEVCREWLVHEDEALAYQLQKKEVEQHYGGNKERNARVREDFPKAKEEQEKEIAEAAAKYRQMARQQEQIDSTYAVRVAEKLDKEEYERRRRAEIRDLDVARKMQITNSTSTNNERPPRIPLKGIPWVLPDPNRVGLPIVENSNVEPINRRQSSYAVTHSLRQLRIGDDREHHDSNMGKGEACLSNYQSAYNVQRIRTTAPATLLPEDVNEIIADVDLQEEANKRLQEEQDAEFARLLQKQEEEILSGKADRDRMLAIEAQDKELAKLLYEKEKAKLRKAKERARQRALLKKQQHEQQTQNQNENTITYNSVESANIPQSGRYSSDHRFSTSAEEEECSRIEERPRTSSFTSGRITASPIVNVAMHIDPTYLSQQSSSMPNSLIFAEGETTAPPYMPIQGQRRNSPLGKKIKKSKSKEGCKQQ